MTGLLISSASPIYVKTIKDANYPYKVMKNIIIKFLVLIFISTQIESCSKDLNTSIQNACDSVSKSNPIDLANSDLSPFTDKDGKKKGITVYSSAISKDFKPIKDIEFRNEDGTIPDRDKIPYGFFEYADGKNKIANQEKFQEIRDFSWGMVAVRDRNSFWGFVSGDGKMVIPPKFISVSDFTKGIATFSGMKGYPHKTGFINRFGNIIIDLESQNLHVDDSQVSASFKYKCGLYPVFQVQTNIFNTDVDSWTRVRWAYINKDGKLVSPFYSESEVVYEVNK